MMTAVMLFLSAACEKPDDDMPAVGDDTENTDDKVDTEDKPDADDGWVTNVVNPYADKTVSYLGTTVSVKFDASTDWSAELKFTNEADAGWAEINSNTVSGAAKKGCTVRISVKQNKTPQKREVALWLNAEGQQPEKIAVLTQASSGSDVDADMNRALNEFMHDILKDDYLFADAYNKLDVNMSVPYSEFLSAHLLKLGDVNVEDGGYYKAVQSNAGQRYIYSSLVEVQPVTKVTQVAGLGFGPFISSSLPGRPDEMCLAPSYVRRESPAEKAGLKRGDMIYAVNGTRLTTSNYRNYMNSLYQNPTGSYKFSFLRYESDGNGGYSLNSYDSGTAYAGPHNFDPVLHASIIANPDNPKDKIAYMVFETFDLNSHEYLVKTISDFVDNGVTDMILDLRFNYGGAVAQSRWLSGCIAGASNWNKTFTEVVYNDGKTENWTFGNGYTTDTDNLGKPADLKLDRIYIIGSYNTASAAELVINSLRGINFDVKLIGSQTEGKNVGMNVTMKEYKGRHFQFQPVTFYVKNAKGFGDYADGFTPDEIVNNSNSLYTDDADNVFPYSFSDWGNLDFNIALQWAYCDITGKARWDNWSKEHTRSSSSALPVPVGFQPMAVPAERAGNLIY